MTEEQFRQRCHDHALAQLSSLFAEMHGRTGHGFHFDLAVLKSAMRAVSIDISTVINHARVLPTETVFEEIAGDMKTVHARAAHQAEIEQLLQECGLRRPEGQAT